MSSVIIYYIDAEPTMILLIGMKMSFTKTFAIRLVAALDKADAILGELSDWVYGVHNSLILILRRNRPLNGFERGQRDGMGIDTDREKREAGVRKLSMGFDQIRHVRRFTFNFGRLSIYFWRMIQRNLLSYFHVSNQIMKNGVLKVLINER